MSFSSILPTSVVLTFDNLSEAAEMQRGEWPAGRPLGQHPWVTKTLPRLLKTMSVPAANADWTYPPAGEQ